MPTITASLHDLAELLGRPISEAAWLEGMLPYVKGELKGWDPAADECRIELNDTNRPDLWCPEGIARQIRTKLTGTARRYPFLDPKVPAAGVVEVDESLIRYRPYLAAFTAKGPAQTDRTLRQLIQAQEKLSDTFGRRRKSVATGVYKLAKVRWPIRYTLAGPDEQAFVPLGKQEKLTPRQIMAQHETAREYAAAVDGYDRYPLIVDADGRVLSMPPIINSADVGQVEVGDRELFIEVTGTDLRQVVLAVNIFAANLADRGYAIEPVAVKYPYETPLGTTVRTPCNLGQSQDVELQDFSRALGEPFEAAEVEGHLRSFGLALEARGAGRWRVRPPFWRNDLLHPMDVVEDLAIARGFDSFKPEMPTSFTVGRLSPIETFSTEVRALMVEAGFTEILSPILTHRDKLARQMRMPGRRIVAIQNPMSENYSVIRDAVLPSLLEVETASAKATYPHRIFEVGETAVRTPAAVLGSTTYVNMAAAVFHAEASFSEVHGYLERLFYFLDAAYELKVRDHPTGIPGRSARIVVRGRDVGGLGELHPEVLERWGIKVPGVALELNLDVLRELLGRSARA